MEYFNLLVLTEGQFEGKRGVMALEHANVVVEHGERVSRVAEEGGGGARVVDVVCRRRDQRRGSLQRLQEVPQALLLQEVCHGLLKKPIKSATLQNAGEN